MSVTVSEYSFEEKRSTEEKIWMLCDTDIRFNNSRIKDALFAQKHANFGYEWIYNGCTMLYFSSFNFVHKHTHTHTGAHEKKNNINNVNNNNSNSIYIYIMQYITRYGWHAESEMCDRKQLFRRQRKASYFYVYYYMLRLAKWMRMLRFCINVAIQWVTHKKLSMKRKAKWKKKSISISMYILYSGIHTI